MTDKTFGSSEGLTVLAEDQATPANGMVAYVTSSWNSGYQNGDIKLAALSDTDDTDLVGAEFLSTLSGFTSETLSASAGDHVFVSVTWSGRTAGYAQITLGGTIILVTSGASGTVSGYFSVNSNSPVFNITAINSFDGTIDARSVKLADEDRSVNQNGLIVNGTVTRSPVATGADLVAYSGFSASNYLEQPYNSDLDFGTGDFCVMGWVRRDAASSSQVFFDRNDIAGTGPRVSLLRSSLSEVRAVVGSTAVNGSGVDIPGDTWTQVGLLRRDGIASIIFNGEIVYTQSATDDVDNTSAVARLGIEATGGAPADKYSLSLFRISATAPTAEEIKKMYDYEKFLFQENAQATLYGTSDAVTALAHDPVTDLLHVGTSDGRSVFQGLRRVDNTTDAVSTAISASNNLIVEQ